MNRHRLRPGHLGRRHPNLYAVMLFIQLFDRIGSLDPKPPVTLFLIALNLAIFYFQTLAQFLPPDVVRVISPLARHLAVRKGCLHPSAVLSGQRLRLILASFIHLTDLHVLFNCTSFLYKGVILEAAFGSLFFLALIVYLAFTANVLYIVIALLSRQYGFANLMNNCVAGFSGVLFGLKFIVNSNPQYQVAATQIFGINLPGGAAVWTELLIASALMPNVSFVGHLCGIFAGMIYVYAPKAVVLYVLPVFRALTARRTRAFQGRGRRLHEHTE